MPRRSKANTAGMPRIEDLLGDVARQFHGSTESPRRAAGEFDDLVETVIAGFMQHVRASADAMTEEVAERAAKAGSNAFKKVVDEAAHHPLATLVAVAGIGFLLESARR